MWSRRSWTGTADARIPIFAAIPGGRLYFAKGLHHGEPSIPYSGEYARLLNDFFSGNLPDA